MPKLVLTNAHLVPGKGDPKPNSTVVVEGERIERVTQEPYRAAPEDRVVDLGGRTVMPGLITCHHHAGYHKIGSYALPVGFEAPPAYLILAGGKNMETLLDCGFTSAVGAGNGFAMDASLKQAAEDKIIRGPRLMACGRGLSTTGFSLDRQQPWFWNAPNIDVRTCDGADGFRKAVREEIREGAEIIKLYPTGGHLSITPGNCFEMAHEEIAAAVQTAHAQGAKVRAHVSNAKSVLEAVALGVDVIDHADFVDEAGIEAMARAGSFCVPSMRLATESLRQGWYQGAPDEMRAEAEHMLKTLPRLREAGVKLVLGDDYGVLVLDHGRQGEELSFYVDELGVPALEVIEWATVNGAELMGRSSDLGSIEPGMIADLIVVDGNPLERMSLLNDRNNLLAIMKDGEFMKDNLSSIIGGSQSADCGQRAA